MSVISRTGRSGAASPPERTLTDASVKVAAGWIAQFARTLKTCRLYDAMNPTVIRFRDELSQAAYAMIRELGTVTYRFESDDVTVDGVSVHPARSRDDNLAYPFHRDGVRGITINGGVTSREIDAFVDCVLAVTGQNLDGDDLVTLLWEAHLTHMDVDYVPAQGDVGAGAPTPEEGAGALMPWPAANDAQKQPEEAPAQAPEGGTGKGRSEDWTLGDLTVEVEASFVELDAMAGHEIDRFRAEYAAEHRVSPVTAAVAIAQACVKADPTIDDRREIARFLPRVLRTALSSGAWAEAREALRMLRALGVREWSEETFRQELQQPVTVARVVEQLDKQGEAGAAEWLALADDLGDAGIDWMTLVLSESQQRDVRLGVAEALTDRCRDNPERLASWLTDGRWYVVRNIVHILGWIGGAQVAGLLQVALRHPDSRVREEVVVALGNVELKIARPLLIRAVDGAESKLFCQVLARLSAARDAATARWLFAFLQQERFEQRPPEERRAIYAALASVGGDEIVPELEAELVRQNWFDRSQEIHRHNVARILARIATPRACEALRTAAESKRPPVRQAAQSALDWMKGT
ncbi:MAG: HEAT repeat domain-containing protein [Candidatus Eisenbacteria bacterium]|uniref:HEAT repeat domain-containing protein n=1 Tax=Eiseniibacteriota bacterium TaxID=2212470 RepID=A0A933SB40_UNCEI|nr:HEAT repeat domain-containing protein [Candidatus Eisenbacteria bacterium]